MNGWWVTGFADGESWFFSRPLLRGYKKDRSIQVQWSITLRDDDEEVIYRIKDYLGVGSISRRTGKSKVNNGQISLNVYGVKSAKVLIEHFTKYPLQSKKVNDYIIWKQIVERLDKKLHLKSDKDFIETVKLCDDLRIIRLYEKTPNQLKSVSGSNKLYVDKVLERI